MRLRPGTLLLLLLVLLLPGCELVGDVLAVGFWAGVIVVGVVLLLIWMLVRGFRR